MEIISILFKSWHYLIEINLILFILASSFSHFVNLCVFVPNTFSILILSLMRIHSNQPKIDYIWEGFTRNWDTLHESPQILRAFDLRTHNTESELWLSEDQ